MTFMTFYESPVGRLTLASDGEALTGLWIEGQKYYLGGLKEMPPRRDALPIFGQTKEWLGRYFAGEKPRPEELPLRPQGSDFQKMIWRYLTEIPYGSLTTYKELAQRAAAERSRMTWSEAERSCATRSEAERCCAVQRAAGGEEHTARPKSEQSRPARPAGGEKRPVSMSAQAAGGAVGHNPISIIIPCHRVVAADGSLTGYAGGLDVKERLLELEGVDLTKLYRPGDFRRRTR